jgi:hypothetical protein
MALSNKMSLPYTGRSNGKLSASALGTECLISLHCLKRCFVIEKVLFHVCCYPSHLATYVLLSA